MFQDNEHVHVYFGEAADVRRKIESVESVEACTRLGSAVNR